MSTGALALYSFESEAALIGAAMYAPEACEAAFERLRPNDFGDPVHGAIWAAISTIVQAGGAPGPAIVRDKLGSHEGFAQWGGYDTLFGLWDSATTVGVGDHMAAVSDRAGRRNLQALVRDLLPRIEDTAVGDYIELLSEMERRAGEIAQSGATADNWMDAGGMVRLAIEHARARAGTIKYPFGVPAVDRFTNGMNAGEMTLLGARTGMGKTVGMMTAAKANAMAGLGSCVYSLEMTRQHLGMRLACDLSFRRDARLYSGVTTNVTLDRALKNELTPEQWSMLDEAHAIASRMTLHTDDQPGLTMAQIEARARRKIRQFERDGIEPGPVFIDHLGKVRPGKDRKGSKHAEVADVSNDCAEMAKRLGVPVIGLVQLNRQVEGRGDDKRPVLSDLRQAGELEEDARQVIFLYRPEYYLRAGPPNESFQAEAERKEKLRDVERKLFWIVEKNSHGARGEVLTFCEIGCSAVRDWEA